MPILLIINHSCFFALALIKFLRALLACIVLLQVGGQVLWFCVSKTSITQRKTRCDAVHLDELNSHSTVG